MSITHHTLENKVKKKFKKSFDWYEFLALKEAKKGTQEGFQIIQRRYEYFFGEVYEKIEKAPKKPLKNILNSKNFTRDLYKTLEIKIDMKDAIIKQLKEIEGIEINCYLDNNTILIDESNVIETEDYTINYRLEADILFEYSTGTYNQPPEVNVLKEEIHISELEVFDNNGVVFINDIDYDKIVEIIKNKIEY